MTCNRILESNPTGTHEFALDNGILKSRSTGTHESLHVLSTGCTNFRRRHGIRGIVSDLQVMRFLSRNAGIVKGILACNDFAGPQHEIQHNKHQEDGTSECMVDKRNQSASWNSNEMLDQASSRRKQKTNSFGLPKGFHLMHSLQRLRRPGLHRREHSRIEVATSTHWQPRF